ncbi:UDP-glucuronosyl/UDP-glucosyltransferase [Trema orientale]|uniref:UDP-glucuronosyl/UDP-glucosyltransferase n=1 Tax=Trema orientale TaxID=63057 RepID=A0A2P5ER62_TREOI|nr:UDP-glucuronosyl/UDP-glucosyltransferase [Trema orientale]
MASGKTPNYYYSRSKPHAVCIPFPIQSHIKAMLKFAKLLHQKGFYITFVNTEFNQKRFLKTTSLDDHDHDHDHDHDRSSNLFLDGLPDFRFETIPDGLPPSDPDSTQDIPSLCDSTRTNFSAPFLQLIKKINENSKATSIDVPYVSCIVSDGFMTFAVESAAQHLGIPLVKFFSIAACGLMGCRQYRRLLEKGLVPLKGRNHNVISTMLSTAAYFVYVTNGLIFLILVYMTCEYVVYDDWIWK